MNFGFRRLNLTSKLSLLVVLPVIICLIVLVYFFKGTAAVTEHSRLLLFIVLLIVLYTIAALYFMRKLARDIKLIEHVSSELASGGQVSNGHVPVLPEAQKIVKSIRKIQDDLHHQTSFAEQIKTGNLNALYDLRHAQDSLGKALLSIKDNLVTIKQEDQQRNWASEGLAKFVQILQSAKNLKDLSKDYRFSK